MDGYQPQSEEAAGLLAAAEGKPIGVRPAQELPQSREAYSLLSAAGLAPVGQEEADKAYRKRDLIGAARKKYEGEGIGTLQSFKRSFMGFGELVGPDIPIGGRVVGNREYQEASRRFASGEGNEADANTIALYEHHAAIDQKTQKNANFAEKLVLDLGGLGKIAQEAIVGGKVLQAGGRALGLGRAAAAAAPGVAPAVPAATPLLARAGGYAAAKLPQTVVTPSLYVPMMQQKNLEENRDANDIRGLPTAFGYGYANMLVLGQLQKGLQGNILKDSFKKGVLGSVELQGVDTLAGVADEFLPKAYRFDTKYGNVGKWLSAYARGDKEAATDALTHSATQVLSFGLFAAVHGKEPKAPETLLDAYGKAVDKYAKAGYSRERAGEAIAKKHAALEKALTEEPYMTRERALEVLDTPDPALKDYVKKLADVFEPAKEPATPPELDKVFEEARKEAAANPEQPQAQQPEQVRPGEVPDTTRTTPPRDNESRQAYTERLVSEGVDANRAAGLADAWFPEPGVTKEPAAAATEAERQPLESAAKPVETPTTPVEPQAPEAAPEPIQPEIVQPEARPEPPKPIDETPAERRKRMREAIKKAGAAPEKLTPASENPTPASRLQVAGESPVDTPLHLQPEPVLKAGESPEAFRERHRQWSDARFEAIDAPEVKPDLGPDHADVSPQEAIRNAVNTHSAAVDASDMPAAAKEEYKRLFSETMNALPEYAQKAIGVNLKKVSPHESIEKLTTAILDWHEANARNPAEKAFVDSEREALARGEVAYGGGVTDKGELFIDGGGKMIAPDRGKYALTTVGTASELLHHELGHVVDGGGGSAAKLSKTFEWKKAFTAEIKTSSETATLSEYAETDVREGFAEFFRLVHSSEVPHETIAREFPLATKFFKDRGLWPKTERAGKGTLPVPDVFNKKVDLPDGGHADAVENKPEPAKPEPVAAAATASRPTPKPLAEADPFSASGIPEGTWTPPDKPAKKPKAGARAKKEKVAEKPTPEKPASKADPLDAQIESLPADSRARDYLESARHNMAEGRADAVERLGGMLHLSLEKNHLDAVPELMKAIADAGGTVVPDTTTSFDGARHESKSPISTGDPVRVVSPEVRVGNRTVVKGVVEPVAAAATPKGGKKAKGYSTDELSQDEKFRLSWEGMDSHDRYEIFSDPIQRKLYEDAGIDVAKEYKQAKKAEGRGKKEQLSTYQIEEAIKSAGPRLTAVERAAMIGAVRNIPMETLGKKMGMSGEGARKAAIRGLGKLKSYDTAFEEFKTVQDYLDWAKGKAEDAARERQKEFEGEHKSSSEDEQGLTHVEREANANLGHFFSGVPLKLTFLEGLFGKTGDSGAGLGSRIRRLFAGKLPGEVKTAKREEMDQRLASYAQEVADASKDLRKALKQTGKPYESISKAGLERLDNLLRVPPEETLAAAATAGVPEPVALAIQNMRRGLDKLQRNLIDTGAIDGPIVAKVEGSIGTYLTRQYEVFRDPAWFNKVDKEVVNRFKSWLTEELTNARDGEAPTQEEVTDITQSLLVNGTAAENPVAFIAKSKLGSKDLSILSQRKNIPDELRALWGEYKDPLVNYVNSVSKMSHLLASHLFLKRVATELNGTFVFDKPTGDASHTLAESGDRTMGALAGKYTTLEFKQAFEEAFAKKNVPAWLQAYSKALALTKFMKTVGSPTTHERNFLGNAGFAIANGHWRIDKAPAAFKALVNDTPEGRLYWQKLIKLGIVGEGLNYGEFRDTVNDALGGREDRPFLEAGGLLTDRAIARAIKGGAKLGEKLYHNEDAVWKIYAFENEVARYEKILGSREAAEKKASEIVRATYPTYSMLPEGIKNLRKLPFIGPFVSFPYEVVRTTANTFRIALTELKDPATRSIGATRMAGLAAAATASTALAMAMRALVGISADDEAKARRLLPEYEKNSRLLWMRGKNGEPQYVDLSRTDPHSYLGDAFIAAGRGRTTEESVKLAVKELKKPFTEPEILTQAIGEVALNQKDQGGTVYNPQDTNAEKLKAGAAHLGKAFLPGGAPAARRLQMAASGEVEQKTGKGYDLADELKGLVSGQRVQPLRVEESLAGRARAYAQAIQDSSKITNQLISAKGNVSPEELKAAAERTNLARKNAIEELKADVDAGLAWGLTQKQAAKILREAGVSQDDINAAFGARESKPFQPKLQGSQTSRERAAQVRKPASP